MTKPHCSSSLVSVAVDHTIIYEGRTRLIMSHYHLSMKGPFTFGGATMVMVSTSILPIFFGKQFTSIYAFWNLIIVDITHVHVYILHFIYHEVLSLNHPNLLSSQNYEYYVKTDLKVSNSCCIKHLVRKNVATCVHHPQDFNLFCLTSPIL